MIAIVCAAAGFAAGCLWVRRTKKMPVFLVQLRRRILAGELGASEAQWDAVCGLVGNPAFQMLFNELYRVHVWETDMTPEKETNAAMIRQGARKAIIDLARIVAAAEEYQKEKMKNAAQGPTAEGTA